MMELRPMDCHGLWNCLVRQCHLRMTHIWKRRPLFPEPRHWPCAVGNGGSGFASHSTASNEATTAFVWYRGFWVLHGTPWTTLIAYSSASNVACLLQVLRLSTTLFVCKKMIWKFDNNDVKNRIVNPEMFEIWGREYLYTFLKKLVQKCFFFLEVFLKFSADQTCNLRLCS